MRFEVLPLIDIMLELYARPRDFNRFQEYLNILKGNSEDDMEMPIVAFNPMAKEHVPAALRKLKEMNAEEVIGITLEGLNKKYKEEHTDRIIRLGLCLADDLKGGWTNRYTTDYDSKFRIQALLRRNFCTPIFWTSEEHTPELITQRTSEYCYRSIYFLSHKKPLSLEDHIIQEKEVARQAEIKSNLTEEEIRTCKAVYDQYKDSEAYPVIFSFLYGDEAAAQLGHMPLGLPGEMPGFRFAASM